MYELKGKIIYSFGDIRLAEVITNLLIKHRDTKSIIDIGCGDGIVKDFVDTNLIEYQGYDIDSKIYKVKKNKFIKVINHSNQLKKINKKYDLGLYLDVLEHTESFFEVLDLTLKNIRKELIISIPNDGNWKNRLEMMFKGHYKGNSTNEMGKPLNHRHLWFVNVDNGKKILEKYMKKNNFKLIYELGYIAQPKKKYKRILLKLIYYFCSDNFIYNGLVLKFRRI